MSGRTALFAGSMPPYDPTSTNPRSSLSAPTEAHLLGADFMGRDMFSRIVHGARISLAVGLGSTLLACSIGVAIGLMSGFPLGCVYLVTHRIIALLQALPLLVQVLLMAASPRPFLAHTLLSPPAPVIPPLPSALLCS